MDDTQLRYRYLIDSSCGGVTFSDLMKKKYLAMKLRKVPVQMYITKA